MVLCNHCEVLDVSALLGEGKEGMSQELSDKLKRYYCHNPENDSLLCPNKGNCQECKIQIQALALVGVS